MDLDEALRTLKITGPVEDTEEFRAALKLAWKEAAKRTHPDMAGPKEAGAFVEAQRAYHRVLKELRGPEHAQADSEEEPDQDGFGFSWESAFEEQFGRPSHETPEDIPLDSLLRAVLRALGQMRQRQDVIERNLRDLQHDIDEREQTLEQAFDRVSVAIRGSSEQARRAQAMAEAAVRVAEATARKAESIRVDAVPEQNAHPAHNPPRTPRPTPGAPIFSSSDVRRGLSMISDVVDLGVSVTRKRRR